MRYCVSFFCVYMETTLCDDNIVKQCNNAMYLVFQFLSSSSSPLGDDKKLEWIDIIIVHLKRPFLPFSHFCSLQEWTQ